MQVRWSFSVDTIIDLGSHPSSLTRTEPIATETGATHRRSNVGVTSTNVSSVAGTSMVHVFDEASFDSSMKRTTTSSTMEEIFV